MKEWDVFGSVVFSRILRGVSTHYDAIVIGTGAGGGTLALHLAQAGKNILILERGPSMPQEKVSRAE